jgi:hypothetical protein
VARPNDTGTAGVQGDSGLPFDHHLERAGQNVSDLFARMRVPARLDAGRDLDLQLDDLPPGNRRWLVLQLDPRELGSDGMGKR